MLVIGCSSALLRPHFTVIHRRDLTYFVPKLRKFVSSFQDTFDEQSEANQLVSSRRVMFMALRDVRCSTERATSDIRDTHLDVDTDMKGIVDHQVMTLEKSPAVALVISGVLMLTPFKALAETCEADGSPFSMPLLLFVAIIGAIIGATVGGLLARQRKGELQRLNEQLRQINAALRRQTKIESYAPALSYAPGCSNRIVEDDVIADPRLHELISHLRSGKNFLRNQDPDKASTEFRAALELAQTLKDTTKEKKAARGLGASLQRQGKFKEAIKYHTMVLKISEQQGESSGNTEAYGAIADCFTELGELEQAGKYYDIYISQLQSD